MSEQGKDNPIAIGDLPESLVEFSRARLREEVSQGIFDLMCRQHVKRIRLAELLGVDRSRITAMLGGANLGLDTIADAFLVLGRAPHLILGTNLDELRLPVDEGLNETTTTTGDTDVKEIETQTTSVTWGAFDLGDSQFAVFAPNPFPNPFYRGSTRPIYHSGVHKASGPISANTPRFAHSMV